MYSKLGRKLTNDEFDFRIKDSQFIRQSEYVNSNTSIVFKCKICGKLFNKKPKCFNKLKCKCVERDIEYKEFLMNKNLTIIENYINMRTKIKHKCLKCNLIFISSPKVVKNSVIGCPSCSGKIFSFEKYKSLLPSDILLESDFYDGSNKKLKHKCLKCGFIWETKPNYIIHMNCGCPKCNSSKGERKISEILDSLGIDYSLQFSAKINLINYRFDFYIPMFNLFIEYDGIQHYEPVEYFGGVDNFNIVKKNDIIKEKWCNDNNYNLLRISYNDDIDFKLINYIHDFCN